MIEERQRLLVFRAQTENVHELKRSWVHVNRQINSILLRTNDTGDSAVKILTKIVAFVYCALAEAIFSKLIHTPHGLSLDEIEQIKRSTEQNGVKEGWLKCAKLAIRRVSGTKSGYEANVLQKLSSLIEEYIYDPSVLRNKLAHGQWNVALNRDNTAVNEEITAEMQGLTVVDLYRREHSLRQLAAIIEDMIESPTRAHRRDYWKYLAEIEEGEREMATWTIARKVDQLRKKRTHTLRTEV
jgi:hypothetical protein